MKPKDWKLLLRGSFAGMTAPFAAHPCDERRARQMFHAAMNAGATLEDIEGEARRFLESQGCTEETIVDQLKRIRGYPHNPRKKLRSKRAWVVTREDSDGAQDVVAVFNYRKSSETVAAFLEQHYIATTYSDAEKLTYAKSPRDNPYPAEYDRINGIKWGGRITCGHNPFLVARLALNLAVIEEDGEEKLVWEDVERPRGFPR